MWAIIVFAICCAYLTEHVYSEERQCSRYHYEAQTLERIIRAEIDLVTVKSIVTNIDEKTEQVKKENNDELFKINEKIDILQQKMNNLVRNISETKAKKEGSTTSSMWKFCTSCKTTCSDVDNSECKWMACKCKPGLSYHHDTRKCLPDCGDYGYGNTYQVEIDTILEGFNTKVIPTISLEDCVQRCNMEKNFVCKTVEYYKPKQEFVRGNSLHKARGSQDEYERLYYLYQRLQLGL